MRDLGPAKPWIKNRITSRIKTGLTDGKWGSAFVSFETLCQFALGVLCALAVCIPQ